MKLIKLFFINFLNKINLFEISYLYLRLKYKNKYVRVINYHCTPNNEIDNFKRQIEFLNKFYISLNLEMLESYFESKNNSNKPGIIYTFDDGLSCNFAAVQALNSMGAYAWIMAPAKIVTFNSGSDTGELEFMRNNRIVCSDLNKSGCCNNLFLKLSHLNEAIHKGNEIVSHGFNHKRLSDKLSAEELYEEVITSKLVLENRLNHKIYSFAWVGGEWSSYGNNASKLIKNSTYKFVFSSNAGIITNLNNKLNIGRINIESYMDINTIKVKFAGLVDFKYFFKRFTVNWKLSKHNVSK
jgi:peptidoglycan/xylan/chitin deacetylase (PgdA/CDA1 family)